MIIFMILLIVLAIMIGVTVLAISVGGAAFIIVFADVIVCIAIILWIIKRLWFKK